MKKVLFATVMLLLVSKRVFASSPGPWDASMGMSIPILGLLLPFVTLILVVFLIQKYRKENRAAMYHLAEKYLEQGREIPVEFLLARKNHLSRKVNKFLVGLLLLSFSISLFVVSICYGFSNTFLLLATMFALMGSSYLIVWRYEKNQKETEKCDGE